MLSVAPLPGHGQTGLQTALESTRSAALVRGYDPCRYPLLTSPMPLSKAQLHNYHGHVDSDWPIITKKRTGAIYRPKEAHVCFRAISGLEFPRQSKSAHCMCTAAVGEISPPPALETGVDPLPHPGLYSFDPATGLRATCAAHSLWRCPCPRTLS
jgi:hypothetical protein